MHGSTLSGARPEHMQGTGGEPQSCISFGIRSYCPVVSGFTKNKNNPIFLREFPEYCMIRKPVNWIFFLTLLLVLGFVVTPGCTSAPSENSTDASQMRTITDTSGRNVTIPHEVTQVVCSSGGTCVRYLVYLDGADTLVGVESGEHYNATTGDNRAYVIANPQFADLPYTGSSSSNSASLEQIIALKPQVIFTMGSASNQSSEALSSADTMQTKTGIPVISLATGSLQSDESKEEMYATYRLLGKVLGKEDRAEQLIAYIDATIADLNNRTKDIPESGQKTAFVGGLSHGGAHGLLSTQSEYMPFVWNHVKNVANGSGIQGADFSKEGLIYADPEFIFVDAGTLGVQDEISGIDDIRSPVFADMKAVKSGNVYTTLPYTSRMTNLETQLVDGYFVGKTVYPDRFTDIDPKVKADEIYTMFVGEPVFDRLNARCNYLGFEKVPLS